MKKVLFLFAALFMTCTFTSCSDDDDDYKRMKNLDVSLLPGYWIIVKDGARTSTGVWFSYEPTDQFDQTEIKLICRKARYFSISDDMTTIVNWGHDTLWYVYETGEIGMLWAEEGSRGVYRLTKDKLVISTYSAQFDSRTYVEYERIPDPIVPEALQ
jgi:hypothetical protein